jgi:peptidoglycan/xylan/chitin deacetylase (PgdA/CDA1 family)
MREEGAQENSRLDIKNRVRTAFGMTRVPGGQPNRILLTFDDGPNPTVTPRVLALLAKFNASAIFFIVGARAERAPYVLNQVVASGHLLGNHSYSHQGDLGVGPYLQDLLKTQKLIEATTGTRSTLFRPPGGRPTLASIVSPRLLRLTTVLWSLDSNDWRLRTVGEAHGCANRVVDHFRCHGPNHDILLFHDDNELTPAVLEPVLEELTTLGMVFQTPQQLLGSR